MGGEGSAATATCELQVSPLRFAPVEMTMHFPVRVAFTVLVH